jgi:predicted nuclease of predicted toxin-antitoxin system
MKVLLDENIDVRFRNAFDGSGHEIFTVRRMGWNGLRNGELIQKMKEENFDVLVAVDKNIPFQQNPQSLGVSIFILDVKRNVLSQLLPFVARLLAFWEEPLEKRVYVLKEE